MQVEIGRSLLIYAPEFFRDDAFVAWLNNGQPKYTIHQGASPGEYSDVIVLVDPSLEGEGSDSDMPAHIWDAIVGACRKALPIEHAMPHISVRLTNLDE